MDDALLLELCRRPNSDLQTEIKSEVDDDDVL